MRSGRKKPSTYALLFSYVLPYFGYVLVLALGTDALGKAGAYALALAASAAGIAFAWRWYLPLPGPRSPAGSVAAGIVAGLAGTAAWIAIKAPFYEAGKEFFHRRQGQLNLSCAQCHDDNAGRPLRGDTISYGLGNGYPAYRLEWQTVGSLHRRLRSCAFGVRAVQFDYGSPEYVSLELFLAKRAEGVAIETPAIRR